MRINPFGTPVLEDGDPGYGKSVCGYPSAWCRVQEKTGTWYRLPETGGSASNQFWVCVAPTGEVLHYTRYCWDNREAWTLNHVSPRLVWFLTDDGGFDTTVYVWGKLNTFNPKDPAVVFINELEREEAAKEPNFCVRYNRERRPTPPKLGHDTQYRRPFDQDDIDQRRGT